jgi:hypothetical protein
MSLTKDRQYLTNPASIDGDRLVIAEADTAIPKAALQHVRPEHVVGVDDRERAAMRLIGMT